MIHRRERLIFRRNTSIGAADALDDKRYLLEGFIDTGYLATLADVDDPQYIVVGRTGAGKTALLLMHQTYQERVCPLDLENLALTYVVNNNVLNFFAELGVDLDLFYRVLWRHIFVVEVLQQHYEITDSEAGKSFLTQLWEHVKRNKSRNIALNYLEKYRDTLWLSTEQRIKDITQRFESDLRASVNSVLGTPEGGATLDAGFGASQALSEEIKVEVQKRGREVVEKAQLEDLYNVMELLSSEILEDSQKKYFITVDKLDEGWVTENFRYPLIAALLDAAKTFNRKVGNAKVIVALREDLVDRVFRYVRQPGYQGEKYDALKLNLLWEPSDLLRLVDKRIEILIRDQYTSQPVKFEELIPKHISVRRNKVDTIKYIMDRTMLRPRDVITFVNECLQAASGKPQISKDSILKAEEQYSSGRLDALQYEWKADYPNLQDLCLCLKGFPQRFAVSNVLERFYDNSLYFLDKPRHEIDHQGPIYQMVEMKFNQEDKIGLMRESLKILHQVSVIGVKPESYLSVYWSHLGQRVKSLDETCMFYIHPAFWRVLGVKPSE